MSETRRGNGTFAPGTSGNRKGRPRRAAPREDAFDGLENMPSKDVLDAWVSSVTGIGTGARDKRVTHRHISPCTLSYDEVAQLWETDDMGAKAIEAPGAECFREGFELIVPDESSFLDLKQSTEEKLADLGVEDAIETILAYERAYGGGAILLGADDGRALDAPLEQDRVKSLDWINVLEPIEITPAQYYEDPNGANYGKPEYYQLNATGFAGPMVGLGASRAPQERVPLEYIHESRLIVFGGVRVSKRIRSSNSLSQFWGTPQVLRFIDALRDFHITWSNAGIIATDVSQPVITMPNLLTMIAKQPEAFKARMQAMELSRSTARALLLDAKEKFERITTSLAGLPELLDRISQRLASAIGMPLSIMMGYSPEGLGKPGSVELTHWYNTIRSLQRRRVGPVIRKLAKMLMSTLRKRKLPKTIGVRWCELERMTDAARAEARLTQARTDSMNIKSGMLTPDEARRSRYFGGYSFETQVQENKRAPGSLELIPKMLVPGVGPQVPVAALAGAQPPNGTASQGAHSVRGYARSNPTEPRLGANPSEGGDVANGKENRDAGYTAASEFAHQSASLTRARASGASPAAIAALEQVVAVVEREKAACDSGECGDDCPYDHTTAASVPAGALPTRTFAGLPIVIENPAGSTRSWVDSDGTEGSTKMRYDYGYVAGTLAADGEGVDVYLGPSEDAPWVYVIHQQSKASGFANYDEDKVMLGFDSPNHARDAYLRQYDDDRFLGGMSQMSLEDFQRRVKSRVGQMVACSSHDELDEHAILDHLDRIEQRGAKWVILARDRVEVLGEYDAETQAIHRLAQIECFRKRASA